jgi:hypothetical protein
MDPKNAVEILKSMDDQLIIDVMRAVEAQAQRKDEFHSGLLLSLMPPEGPPRSSGK